MAEGNAASALLQINGTAPNEIINTDGTVNYGIYRGRIQNTVLRPGKLPFPFWGPLANLRLKKWQFFSVETNEFFMTTAVLHAGYATKAVLLVYIKEAKQAYTFDATVPLNFSLMSFGQSSIDKSTPTRFSWRNNSLTYEYIQDQHWQLSGSVQTQKYVNGVTRNRRCEFDIIVKDTHATQDQLSVVFPYSHAGDAYTHKALTLPSTGLLTVNGQSFSIQDSRAALDWTCIYAPYLTQWKWLFVNGRLASGELIGINISSEEHYGDKENIVIINGSMTKVGPARFTLPSALDNPAELSAWTIESVSPGAEINVSYKLTFTPLFKKPLFMRTGIIDSEYIQLIGTISGNLHVGNSNYNLTNIYAICERQQCLW